MEMSRAEPPTLSVVVPVLNGERFLPRCLAALRASRTNGCTWELIVVDDGSSDRSAEIATGMADRVIRLSRPLKPSAARNRGVDAARGGILVFVDADVVLHPDALGLLYETLTRRPEVSAVFGAYDLSPAAPGLVSQYRNLLHHYFHERDAGETVTFWAGIGAIRREAFESVGGFDEGQFPLEDVELGYRLSARGYRIALRPEIQGTHLKRWSLSRMILADVRDRGVPWTRLLFAHRYILRRPTLNVRRGEQVLTGLMGLATLFGVIGLVSGNRTWLLGAAAAVALTAAGNWPFTIWLARRKGWWFALRTVPLRLLYYWLNVVSVGLGLLPTPSAGRKRSSRGVPVARPAP
jgi:glycosyltransferase involved in cell wall biosynthesis